MRARQWVSGVAVVAATVGGAAVAAGPDARTSPAVVGASGGGAEGDVEVGETVAFSMPTHCGVESARIDGRVWNAVEPLYASAERLGPPPGWDDPEQEGRLTLEAPDRAVFTAVGRRVVLVPSASGQPLRSCD